MDRFTRLEFGDKAPKKGPDGEPVRDAEYFYKNAYRYWFAADFELALRNFSRVLEEDSSIFGAWSGQITALIELGEHPEAIVWADKALESFPEHPELLALKAVAYSRDAKFEKAIAYSDNSVSKNDVTPIVWLARAEVLLHRKSPVAENCISKAVGCGGELGPFIKLEAARLLRRKHRYSKAIAYLNEVVQSVPKSALAWYELGCCQAKLGLPQAKVSLEQCCQLRPDWAEAKRELKHAESRGFLRKLFGR
ncbi:MAG: tetratricopeptide repeat protein [Sedimentisphaerales bacterium]|nr:tetratricopeptide repeat protein [Sedimentisphaerales bacterium]